MEENSLIPKKNRLGTLAFLEVGVFEIFFVIVTLAIFFGAMNYFNILPISQIWPNQLGFLPHREYNQSQQSNNLTIKQSSNISPPPSTSVSQQAKDTLNNFLPTILTSSILSQSPSQTVFTQDKQSQELFTSSWNTKEGRVGLDFRTSKDFKKIISMDLVYEKILVRPTPTVDAAKPIIAEIFSITPKGTWGCKPVLTKRTYCENFWQEKDSKRGLGIYIIPTSSSGRVVFSFCEHSKESDQYSWKSCRSDFLDTGVQ